MELLLNIVLLILLLLPDWLVSATLRKIFLAVARVVYQLIWSVAVLVRRDEHTADTEEWIDRVVYGMKPQEQVIPASDPVYLEPPPEPLDTLDPATPDPPMVKAFSWITRAKWPGEGNL